MKLAEAAALIATLACILPAAEAPHPIVRLDYAKATGLVAAAYEGGAEVVWEFESARVKTVLNAGVPGATRNQPLARFSADGKRIAYTTEGEAGLAIYDVDSGGSKGVVPRRLLYLGIRAVRWSHQEDALLVTIGRDVALVNANGRFSWQRRLETQSVVTDVTWHPDERSYTVATDDTTISSYDTIGGQLVASTVLDSAARATDVKIAYPGDGSSLAASVAKKTLLLLNPETLKIRKTIPCDCAALDWGPKKQLAASSRGSIALLTETGQRRDVKTEGSGPLLWVDESRILTSNADGTVALRELKTGKIVRTFAPRQ